LDVYNTSTITWIDVSEGTREEWPKFRQPVQLRHLYLSS
jgi:hypothetical protein